MSYPPPQGGVYPGYAPPAAAGGYAASAGPGGYPPPPGGTGGYPAPPGPAPGGYPAAAPGSYPAAPGSSGGYPPPGGYPAAPSSPGQYPPPAAGGYPGSAPGGYPPPAGGYPPQVGGYPGSAPGGYGAAPAQAYPAPGGGPYGSGPIPPVGGHPHQAAYGSHSMPVVGAVGAAVAGRTAPAPAHPHPKGTVTMFQPFNADADAQALRKAMKGFGTDEAALIQILCNRTTNQRMEIRHRYKTLLGRDLLKDIKSETSGEFQKTLSAMLMSHEDYDAWQLRHALTASPILDNGITEILASRTPHQVNAIKTAYHRAFGTSLEADCKKALSGDYQYAVLSVLEGRRDPDTAPVNFDLAATDARNLYKAGEKRIGTDEKQFIAVLCYRSFAHIRQVCVEYSKLCKYDLEESIEREFSGNLRTLLKAVVRCARNMPRFFASCLNKSMKGAGTVDHALQRQVVTRCEIDMVQIKEEYMKVFKKSLGAAIRDDTSGDYRKTLLALIKEAY